MVDGEVGVGGERGEGRGGIRAGGDCAEGEGGSWGAEEVV